MFFAAVCRTPPTLEQVKRTLLNWVAVELTYISLRQVGLFYAVRTDQPHMQQ